MAVYEVLIATSPVRNLIREGKTNQIRNAMQMGLSAGHRTMEMSLIELVTAGFITQETAVATAFVPHEVDPEHLGHHAALALLVRSRAVLTSRTARLWVRA